VDKKYGVIVSVVLSLICAAFGFSLIDHPSRAIGAPYLYGPDFATVQHFLESGRMFWKADGHLVGYHPWFMAGYPYADYTSGVCWKILGVILLPLNTGTVATIFLVGPLFLFPLAGYITLKLAGRSEPEALAGSFLSACLVLFGPPLYITWMGLGESMMGVGLALIASGLLLRWNNKGGLSVWIGLVLALALAFMAHKMALVALFIIGLGVVFGRYPVFRIALSALAGAVAFALNLFWILPLWRNREYFDFAPHYHWGEMETLIPFGDFFQSGGSLGSLALAWTLLAGTVVGWRILRGAEKNMADAWLGAQALLAVFAYIGPYVDFLAPAQPRRFIAFFLALSVFPASLACYRAIQSLKRWARLPAVALFAMLLFLLPNAYNRVAPFKIMTSLPPRAQAVTDWISQNTTRDARVMVEEISDAGRPDNPYQGSYLNALLPTLTEREIIGGPYPGVDILHHRVTLLEGALLGKAVSGMSEAELARIFDLYNIGWVVAFSAETKKRFLRAGSLLEKSAQFGPIQCFTVKGAKSFLIGGKGRVRARANAIEVKITQLEGKSVIIKYHWAPSLEVDGGGVRIERYDVAEDPVGFIRAYVDSLREFVIVNKY